MATSILLDTHTWLWMNGAPDLLSATAQRLLTRAETRLFLSAASVWELAIKVAAGRLTLPKPVERYVPERMASNRLKPLAMSHRHALRAAALPAHHRDPFDRMLVAQAQLEGLRLMTVDANMGRYDVEIVDPRGSD